MWELELKLAEFLPTGDEREQAIEAARQGLTKAEALLDETIDAHWSHDGPRANDSVAMGVRAPKRNKADAE